MMVKGKPLLRGRMQPQVLQDLGEGKDRSKRLFLGFWPLLPKCILEIWDLKIRATIAFGFHRILIPKKNQ